MANSLFRPGWHAPTATQIRQQCALLRNILPDLGRDGLKARL
jgi:hypothetical protein